jgi:transposase-like protein
MQRKSYPADFRARVALEAIRESRTVAELSSAFEVHSTMITRWKRQVLEQLPILFSERIQQKEKDSAELIASLYQQIGQLKVESDWLKKSLLSSSRGETGANRRRTQPDPHNATM